jgi:hypothetical protein
MERSVVQDYSNPNEVYYKLYGAPAPYVGASGTATDVFKNTGQTFGQAQNIAKSSDILQSVARMQDVLKAENQNNRAAPEDITIKSVMDAQGGLRLPGSGEKVDATAIQNAYERFHPTPENGDKQDNIKIVTEMLEPAKHVRPGPVTHALDPNAKKMESPISRPLSLTAKDIYARNDKFKTDLGAGGFELVKNLGGSPVLKDKATGINYLQEQSSANYYPVKLEGLTPAEVIKSNSFGFVEFTKDDGLILKDKNTNLKYKRDTPDGNYFPIGTTMGSFGVPIKQNKPSYKPKPTSGFMGLFNEIKQDTKKSIPRPKPRVKKQNTLKSSIPKSIQKSKYAPVLTSTSLLWGNGQNKPNKPNKSVSKKKTQKQYSAWEQVMGVRD